jgi:hypothetical protein
MVIFSNFTTEGTTNMLKFTNPKTALLFVSRAPFLRRERTFLIRSKLIFFFCLAGFAFLLSFQNAAGQNANTAQNTNQNSSSNQQIPANTGVANSETAGNTDKIKPFKVEDDYHNQVTVTEVYNLDYKEYSDTEEDKRKYKRRAGLNDIIIVRVKNLKRLLDESECVGKPAGCKKKSISLFIDGREIKGIKPESGAPKLDSIPVSYISQTGNEGKFTTTGDGELRYHLKRVDDSSESIDNSEHWADLLGLRLDDLADIGDKWIRKVEVSVGLSDEYPVSTKVRTDAANPENQFGLTRARFSWFLVWMIIAGIIIAGMILLALKTNLLRERQPVLWKQRNPYSLSAIQAAWWFALVFLSFVFIWLVTGQYDLSATALVLLSIGSGTALGAKIIDINKQNKVSVDAPANAETLNLLLAQKEEIEIDLSVLERSRPGNAAAFRAKQEEYKDKIEEIRKDFPYAIGQENKGFFVDLLSDIHGVNFHRFQLLVWTIILGLFFIISSLGRLAMAQFSETLLALMGISAGTYLGFKIPEKNHMTMPVKASPEPKKPKSDIKEKPTEDQI